MITGANRLVSPLLAAAAFGWLALSTGCDMGLQDELDKKKDERFATAAAALAEIAESRLTKPGGIAASLPDKLDSDVLKRGKQIVAWRMALADAKHVDPKADPKAREAAVQVKALASKRFATSGDALAEVDKLVTAYNVDAGFAQALRDTAVGASGRRFEEEINRAIEKYSPVRTYQIALNKLADEYKGTPAKQAAIDAAAYAKASHTFWAHAKKNNFGKMRGTAAKYIKFLKGYLKTMNAKIAKAAGDKRFVKRVFLDEAAFDLVFLHGASIWRGTNPVPFWAIRFGVSSGSARNLNDYVTKLCRESDQRKACLPVPHERRPDALRKPYLSWVQEQARAYVAAHPAKDSEVFRTVMTQLDKDLAAAVKAVPDLREDPVMPEMVVTRSPSSGFNLLMSKTQGVKLTGLKMVPLEMGDSFAGKLPAGFKAKVTAKVAELVNPEAKAMVDPATVSLFAEGSMPGTEFRKLVEAFPYEHVAKIDLVGRRRADESMKRAGVLLRRPRSDSGKKLTYLLEGMDEKAKVSCSFAGYGGDMSNRKVADKFLIFTKDGTLKAGVVERHTEETAGKSTELVGRIKAMKVTATFDQTATADIQKHADTLSGGVRVFVPTTWTYNDIMKTLTGLMTKCSDVDLKVGPYQQQKLTISCGETKERPFRFDLGLCD